MHTYEMAASFINIKIIQSASLTVDLILLNILVIKNTLMSGNSFSYFRLELITFYPYTHKTIITHY